MEMLIELPFVVLFVVGGSLTGVGVLAWKLSQRLTKEWTCTWQGHQVRLVATQNRKELWVDGVSVAHRTTLSGLGATLEATVDGVALVAVVHSPDGVRTVGRIYANGTFVGGERRLSKAAAAPRPAEEPADPRWAQAKHLLADLRGGTSAEAAGRIEVALRDVLMRLQRVDAAREAHRALGGGDDTFDAARARLEGQVGGVIDALRTLHLAALAGGAPPGLDRVEDLLAQTAADREVDELVRKRRAAAAGTRQHS